MWGTPLELSEREPKGAARVEGIGYREPILMISDPWFWGSQHNSRIMVVYVIWCGETFAVPSSFVQTLRPHQGVVESGSHEHPLLSGLACMLLQPQACKLNKLYEYYAADLVLRAEICPLQSAWWQKIRYLTELG